MRLRCLNCFVLALGLTDCASIQDTQVAAEDPGTDILDSTIGPTKDSEGPTEESAKTPDSPTTTAVNDTVAQETIAELPAGQAQAGDNIRASKALTQQPRQPAAQSARPLSSRSKISASATVRLTARER